MVARREACRGPATRYTDTRAILSIELARLPGNTQPHRTSTCISCPRAKGYVQVIENGHAVMRLCLQPVECLPDADVVALHKLMIEANEETYLQKANKYLCID